MVGLNSASQIANIEKEINDLTQKLNSLRESYASFLANSQEGGLNILSVIEPANLPSRSVGINKLIIMHWPVWSDLTWIWRRIFTGISRPDSQNDHRS